MESEEVSLHFRRRSDAVLEASVCSLLAIDETRQGVRRSVLLAIDVAGGADQLAEVERFCLEHSTQVGVLSSFLLTNGTPDTNGAPDANDTPDARMNEVLARHRVVRVTVAEGDGYVAPTPDTVLHLSELLLGAMAVGNVRRRLEQVEANAGAAPDGDAEDLLHGGYLALLSLYRAESEFLGDSARPRSTVAVTSSGIGTAMAAGYAVQTSPLDGRQMSVFLPGLTELERGLSLAATAYSLALRLERAGFGGPTAEAVGRLSRLFLSYYLSWLDGRRHTLARDRLHQEYEAFIGAPHISLISAGLADLPPVDQMTFLNLLRGLRARAATQDLLDGIDAMVPKAQAMCLEALAEFGTLDDIEPLEPYVMSPRESIREAALKVIGRMGGDAAAAALVQLYNMQIVPLSVVLLDAIASTRSLLALRNLIVFGASRKEAEPPLFAAVESCLDSVGVEAVRGAEQLVPADVLERYVDFLLDAGATRLALKLIGVFESGVEHIERALRDESLVTRVYAIRVVPLVPSDRLVQAMVDALADLPDDYAWRKLRDWMNTNMGAHQGHDGPAGRIGRLADLDLRSAVMDALAQIDTDLARTRLAELAADAPETGDETADENEDKVGWRNTPLVNSVFRCPGGLTIWVSHESRERKADGMAMAALIHDNRFEGTQGLAESASMLSGGISMTQGTETEILEDVVYPCLRGESPRFPTSAGMGETVMTKIEDGRTVITGRRDIHDPDTAGRKD
jgi:HEAT repeat protein